MIACLEARSLTKRFGGITAVSDVSFAAQAGDVTALIGPNGAGKTTVFNLISGRLQPDAGDVRLAGASVLGLPTQRRAALGIGRTFQNVLLFDEMTALENVLVGRHARERAGLLASALRLPWATREESSSRESALACLARVGLEDQANTPAGALPFGQQRLLAIARALAAEPRLLLLDEPGAGLNAAESVALGHLIRGFADRGLAVLLVEHDMGLVMRVADRVVVLDFGERIAEGTPADVRTNPAVIAAYLGEEVPA